MPPTGIKTRGLVSSTLVGVTWRLIVGYCLVLSGFFQIFILGIDLLEILSELEEEDVFAGTFKIVCIF